MGGIQFVKNKAEFAALVKANKYLVANFTASWCGPCQAIKPLVDALYEQPEYQDMEVVRVDLDQCREVAAQYSISAVPSFVFFELGAEVKKIQGFTQELKTAFSDMAQRASADSDANGRSLGALAQTLPDDLRQHIPPGFELLNDTIHFGELVALNAMPLHEDSEVKNVFRLAAGHLTVYTDTDSQALFFVPLNNISKVHSVLLKLARPQAPNGLTLDADDLDECQTPSVLKVWANKPGVLSFDDAAADAPHVEKIEAAEGWYQAKLRYVRFQNVQNLNIFIDGADEDFHTVVEKIAIVGFSGDSREQGPIAGDDE